MIKVKIKTTIVPVKSFKVMLDALHNNDLETVEELLTYFCNFAEIAYRCIDCEDREFAKEFFGENCLIE